MENRNVLIDTGILIEFLRKYNKQKSLLWKLKENNYHCFISSITTFELYAGAKTTKHLKDLELLFRWIQTIPLTFEIAKRAGMIYSKLRTQNKIIEFRDIFISATALELNFPLITLNEKHFFRIPDISILSRQDIFNS